MRHVNYNTRDAHIFECAKCSKPAVDCLCGEWLCRDCMCPDYPIEYVKDGPAKDDKEPKKGNELNFSAVEFGNQLTEAMIREGISTGAQPGKESKRYHPRENLDFNS